MNAIVTAWQYAELASHEPKSPDSSYLLEDSLDVTPMENNEDSGYVAEFPDRIVISFRGTKNLLAWITDFMAFPLRWENTLKNTKTGAQGTIHNEFYEAWSYFKPVIENYLMAYATAYKDKASDTWKAMNISKKDMSKIWKGLKLPPIYVYGHSRGGALAALCARHIAKNLGIPCSCIMFGAPMQGNKVYRDEFNLLPINCTDVIHGYEFTWNLPPDWSGFRRVGRFLHLPEPKWHKVFRKIRDHYPTHTTEALIQYVKEDPLAVRALERVLEQAHP